MMHWLRKSRRVLPCIAVIYFVAAVVAGFSFAPGPIQTAAAQSRIQALPDGTIPSLCIAEPDDPSGGHSNTARHGCDFCRLTAAPGLLPVTQGLSRSSPFLVLTAIEPAGAAFTPRSVFRATVRAPPPALA